MTLPRFPAHELPAARDPNQPNGGGFPKDTGTCFAGKNEVMTGQMLDLEISPDERRMKRLSFG